MKCRVPAWPLGKPVTDQLGLVARCIVHHDVHIEVGWDILLDHVEEATELGRAMTRHALADDCPCLDVERGEQRRRAMPLVVMGAAFDLPRPQWQDRLRAIQCLYLRLLVDAEHQGPIRRD